MALDADARGPLLEILDFAERLPHFRLGADDADERLHRLLQILLEVVGILTLGATLERRETVADRALRR